MRPCVVIAWYEAPMQFLWALLSHRAGRDATGMQQHCNIVLKGAAYLSFQAERQLTLCRTRRYYC